MSKESHLRCVMDGIGVSNDETAAGSYRRRSSRSEHAVHDPSREMEDMLVDEYGSNVPFQLSGFLASILFDEEEEEEEPEIPKSSCEEHADKSPAELNSTAEAADKFTVTSIERHYCILDDVDGEIEKEDVSIHQNDERAISIGAPSIIATKEQGSDLIFETASNSFSQLTFPMGSPPSPLDSPPPTPPLPTSPPPVSPSSPPPLPYPLLSRSQPHPPPQVQQHPAGTPPSLAPQSSAIHQPSLLPPHLHPVQSSVPSSSPKLAYRLHVPPEHCGTPSRSQLAHMGVNNPHGARIDVNIRVGMFPQPYSCYVSGYNSARPFYFGHTGPYTNPRAPQPSQQFQLVPLPQGAFCPAPPSQASSSNFSYSNPAAQQHPQHPYPQPYTLLTHLNGQRQYHTDQQWMMQSNVFSTSNPHGSWINGVRSSIVPVPFFAHEGYYRAPLERSPTITAGFRHPALNTIPAGPPNQGHNVRQMMPSGPDVSSLGPWRPA